MKIGNVKKVLLPNLPYLLIFWLFLKLGTAYRIAEGADFGQKLIGLFQSMSRHRRILANPKYGLVGFISYLYFLIYELFSPYIEIFGVITVILAFFLDLINIPFMIMFFFIYVLYSAILSLTAFFARIHTIDLKLSLSDVAKAIGLCALEVSCLRFIMAWVRATALIGYRANRQSWGKSQRKKIHFD